MIRKLFPSLMLGGAILMLLGAYANADQYIEDIEVYPIGHEVIFNVGDMRTDSDDVNRILAIGHAYKKHTADGTGCNAISNPSEVTAAGSGFELLMSRGTYEYRQPANPVGWFGVTNYEFFNVQQAPCTCYCAVLDGGLSAYEWIEEGHITVWTRPGSKVACLYVGDPVLPPEEGPSHPPNWGQH